MPEQGGAELKTDVSKLKILVSQLRKQVARLLSRKNAPIPAIEVDLTEDVIGDLPVADGGTGSSSASGARTNLGLGDTAVKNLSDGHAWTNNHTFVQTEHGSTPTIVTAHASPTAALSEWKDSSGTVLFSIDGTLTGTKTPLTHGRLASTANAKGASLIGIEDSAGNITATTVEAALAELAAASGSLTQEQVEDYAGALVATGGTKTGITVTYQDGTGDMDFVVAAQDHGGLGGLGDDDHTQYSKADGSRAFSAAVRGVQGTGDTNLCTNLTAFQRPFSHTAYRSGTFTNGQQIRLFLNTTDNDANFVIPAGQTLYILAAYGRCKSGATAGTTTWTLGIQTWETQAHAGARDWDLATGTTTSTDSYINIEAQGTLASPLAAIVGNDDPVGMVFLEHANSGGGTSGNDKHTIMVYGVFV